MNTKPLQTVLVEARGPVAVITLNRPDRLNAYTRQMALDLFGTLAELDRDDAVRAIVITGAGRAFCAGADLEAGGATFAGDGFGDGELEAGVQPWHTHKPVIVAINGAAVGVGATLPLQWDIRIMSDKAKIGFLFVRRGVMPEASSTWLLPRLIGMAKAMDLLLTGRLLNAEECLAYGLVSRVVLHERLLDEAVAIGTEIAKHTAPLSVAITKQLLWRQLADLDPVSAKAREDALFRWLGKQADAAEGVTAFLEKRDARWTMSPTRDFPVELMQKPRR